MTEARQLVVVTGATGFIAKYCILELLRTGYRVRGTYRSPEKLATLRETLAKSGDISQLELVPADLTADAGWEHALAGANFVLHVASPFPAAPPKHEDELIAPARDGTLRILRLAAKHGVKRVVMTSSIAAVVVRHTDDVNIVYDESAWSETTNLTGAYQRSKTIAERAAWSFMEGLPAHEKLELVTINPVCVLGPLLDRTFSTSLELVKKLLGREVPGCARLGWPIVDVRDVANLHRLAMESDVAAGKRFIGSSEFLTCVEIAETLAQHFGPRGYAVPTRVLPNWLVHVVALFDKTVRLTLPELDRRRAVSAERARTLLGWQPRSARETVIATGESMIEYGLVEPRAPRATSA